MKSRNSTADPSINDLKNPGLLEAIGDGVSIQDTDFRIMYQNAQKNLMGNQIGKCCYQVYEKNPFVCEGCPMADCFRDGKAHTAVRTAEVGGKTLYFEITSSPLKNAAGNIIAGIEVIRDVSDRKRLEEQRLHAQKMESIGTLAGGIAHDFNNILTAIIGFTTILKRRIPDGDRLQTYVEQIHSAANTAADLTKGLLTFSRKQKGNPVYANISAVNQAFRKSTGLKAIIIITHPSTTRATRMILIYSALLSLLYKMFPAYTPANTKRQEAIKYLRTNASVRPFTACIATVIAPLTKKKEESVAFIWSLDQPVSVV